MTACSTHGSLTLWQPGPCALLQDYGRKGLQYLGFSQSGAVDEHAFLWANKLLKNAPHCAALEITLGPFSVEFNHETRIAIAGAAQLISVNNQKFSAWRSFNVRAGDRVSFVLPREGMRTYLAIEGGFQADAHFTSISMAMREGSGPNNGKAFIKGQTLHYPMGPSKISRPQCTPNRFIPHYGDTLKLNVIVNPRQNNVLDSSLTSFFDEPYCISPDSNRMGYRLTGKSITTTPIASHYSHGVPFGSIQIPPDGLPIVLLKDRQTIGGYPILGYVTQRDCFALSQRRPGDIITFAPTKLEEAQRSLKEFNDFFQRNYSW